MRSTFLTANFKFPIMTALILTLLMNSLSYGDTEQWQSSGPNGKSIALSPNFALDHIIYAGSETGGILKSSDGGTSWMPANNGLSNMTIWAIAVSPAFPSDHTLFAGTDGGVFKSTDDGASWATLYGDIGPQSIHSLAMSPDYLYDQTIFAGTWGGGLYKSTDGGTTWYLSGNGVTEPYIPSIALSPAYAVDRTIYAGTWNNGVFKSTDGGANWNSAGITYNHTIHALAVSPGYATDQTVYVGIGGGGGVMKSTNGGASWQPVNNGLSNLNILSMAISPGYADDPTPPGYPGDSTLYSGTFGGGVFTSSDGGSSWAPLNNGLSSLNAWSMAISPAYRNDRTVFAGTDTGLFKFTLLSPFPAASVAPSGLNFGDQTLNTASAEQAITISNTGGAPLTVYAIRITSDENFAISSYTCSSLTPELTSGQSCTVSVTFTPTYSGALNASILIDSNDGTSSTISVPLSGTGISLPPSEPPYYPLSILLEGNGSGTVMVMPNPQGGSCSSSCTRIFADKAVITVTPTAGIGSFFSGWTGCDALSGNQCTVTMDGAKNVTAHFATGGSPIKPAVAAGMANTLILKNDGTVWRWGGLFNGSGPVPQQITELVDSVAISTGTEHSVAMTSEGRVRIWGANSRGQLGSGLVGPRSEITGLTDITAIAAGHWYTAAVRADGTVWSFGDNSDGCLGDGTTNPYGDLVQATGLTGVTAVAASHSTLALKADGTVWSWGRNDNGQLGDGTTMQRSTPMQINGLSNIVSVASNNSHSLALNAIGTVFGWGGSYGPYPYSLTGLSNVVAIAAGDNSSIAVKADGTVWEWVGLNTPVQVTGISGVTAISAADHVMVMKNDGTIWGWGNNYVGQLGDGTLTYSSTPVKATAGTSARMPLTINISGSGTVYTLSDSPCTGTCTQWLADGETVEISASADSGYIFIGWSGCSSVVGSTCVVTMSGGQYISATFAPDTPYTLTATRIGSGSGQVTSISPDTQINLSDQPSSSAQYPAGSTITLTANADSGSSFSGWRGACSGTGPCTVQIGGETSVSAVFSNILTGNPGPTKMNDQFFTLFQDAYSALLTGSSAVIFASDLSIKENLVFDRDIAVTLKGGYDSSFGTNSGLTVLKGTLIITNGSVIMDNIVIQ